MCCRGGRSTCRRRPPRSKGSKLSRYRVFRHEAEDLAAARPRPAGDECCPPALAPHGPSHTHEAPAHRFGPEQEGRHGFRTGLAVVLGRTADVEEEAEVVRLVVAVAAERRQVVFRGQVGRRVGPLGPVVRLERELTAAFPAMSVRLVFRRLGGGPVDGVVVVERRRVYADRVVWHLVFTPRFAGPSSRC